MRSITIRNVGPIGDGGRVDLARTTLFIGDQGSGKSTAAKLIATLIWMEKALNRGDYDEREFTVRHRFRKKYCAYHRIEDFLTDRSEIEYSGLTHRFDYRNGILTISRNNVADRYPLPQIVYVPAERNLLANVPRIGALKLSSAALAEFAREFDEARRRLDKPLVLPLSTAVEVEYQGLNDVLYVAGDDYRIRLHEASSGIQSVTPLCLVAQRLAASIEEDRLADPMPQAEIDRLARGIKRIWDDPDLTDEQRQIAISALSQRFRKSAFIHIVEEPELNLYPASQQLLLFELLGLTHRNEANRLLLTTHSPYLLNSLTLAIKAGSLKQQTGDGELLRRMAEIVPPHAAVSPGDAAVYQLADGRIERLSEYDGIPSDANILNRALGESNDAFDALLDIEEAIR